MGRGDNRRTPKMRRRRAQAKLKARRLRRLLAARGGKPMEPQRANPREAPQPIAQANASGTSGMVVENAAPRFVTAADLIAAVAATTRETQPIVWIETKNMIATQAVWIIRIMPVVEKNARCRVEPVESAILGTDP